jgi:hypothetical protein
MLQFSNLHYLETPRSAAREEALSALQVRGVVLTAFWGWIGCLRQLVL